LSARPCEADPRRLPDPKQRALCLPVRLRRANLRLRGAELHLRCSVRRASGHSPATSTAVFAFIDGAICSELRVGAEIHDGRAAISAAPAAAHGMESPVSSHARRQAVGLAGLTVRITSKPVAKRPVFARQAWKSEHFWKQLPIAGMERNLQGEANPSSPPTAEAMNRGAGCSRNFTPR
jgi:hypothetical protein